MKKCKETIKHTEHFSGGSGGSGIARTRTSAPRRRTSPPSSWRRGNIFLIRKKYIDLEHNFRGHFRFPAQNAIFRSLQNIHPCLEETAALGRPEHYLLNNKIYPGSKEVRGDKVRAGHTETFPLTFQASGRGPAEEGGGAAEDDLHPPVHGVPPGHHLGHCAQTLAVRDVHHVLHNLPAPFTHHR